MTVGAPKPVYTSPSVIITAVPFVMVPFVLCSVLFIFKSFKCFNFYTSVFFLCVCVSNLFSSVKVS